MRLTGVDLNLLVAFDALMSERSVTRAAERVSVGQSAMSSSLARLRRLFDDPLLVRRGRGFETTPLADSLVGPVREALTTIEGVLTVRDGFDPGADTRTFTVMASDYVTLTLLRPWWTTVARDSPGVHLHVRPLAADFTDQLRRGQTDLVIVPDELLGAGHRYPTSPLFVDRFVCAVAHDNPDVGDTLTVEQFSSQPYVAYRSGPLTSLAERQLDAAGITRKVEVTTETFVLAPHLLPGTPLLTLLHERHGRQVEQLLDIRLLEPPMPLRGITEVMTWDPGRDHDPAHRWLRTRMHDLASEL